MYYVSIFVQGAPAPVLIQGFSREAEASAWADLQRALIKRVGGTHVVRVSRL